MRALLVTALAWLLSGAVLAGEVEVSRGPVSATISLPDNKIRLGDPATVILRVDAPVGVEVLMPAFGEFLGQFAVLDFVPRTLTEQPDRQVHEQRYTLQLTRSGPQRIPPILIEFIDLRPGKLRTPAGEDSYELITDALAFEVEPATETDVSEMVAPLPALPPRAILEPRTQAGLGIAAVLAIAGLGGLWWWRKRRRSPIGPTPAQAALAQLRTLADAPCETPAEVEAFFVALSAVVRRYMEDRFGVHAPELTTEEFLVAAQDAHELPPRERAFVGDFLAAADQVKFAGVRPSGASARDALTRIEDSISRTATDTEDASATTSMSAASA